MFLLEQIRPGAETRPHCGGTLSQSQGISLTLQEAACQCARICGVSRAQAAVGRDCGATLSGIAAYDGKHHDGTVFEFTRRKGPPSEQLLGCSRPWGTAEPMKNGFRSFCASVARHHDCGIRTTLARFALVSCHTYSIVQRSRGSPEESEKLPQ